MARTDLLVTIEYADQNDSFRACLPVRGRLLRALSVEGESRPWWVVRLAAPLEYQLKVGEPYQYRLVTARELAIATRAAGQAVGDDGDVPIHILLPLSDTATAGDRLHASEFYHAAWGICRRDAA